MSESRRRPAAPLLSRTCRSRTFRCALVPLVLGVYSPSSLRSSGRTLRYPNVLPPVVLAPGSAGVASWVGDLRQNSAFNARTTRWALRAQCDTDARPRDLPRPHRRPHQSRQNYLTAYRNVRDNFKHPTHLPVGATDLRYIHLTRAYGSRCRSKPLSSQYLARSQLRAQEPDRALLATASARHHELPTARRRHLGVPECHHVVR